MSTKSKIKQVIDGDIDDFHPTEADYILEFLLAKGSNSNPIPIGKLNVG